MILLNGHSLTPMARVPLEGMSLKLTERDATAAITPAVMTGITDGVWLKDDTEPGAGIVWRVRSIQQAYATNTPTVQLEHAVSTLRDAILFGEIKPENISGGSTCTAKQAVEYILARSADWTLGQFDYASVSMPYKFDGDTLYDALEKVTETLADPWWSYDFSVYPFKLNITQKPAGVACELRPGRNLNAISRTVDRAGMYTRFYPIGKEDLHVPGDYISRNENLYGAIAHVETDQSLETVAELTAWANEKLDRHAEPRVTISADGTELADATGEPLDRLTLGRLCRIPLNEFSTVIEERIVELNYRDKVHAPEVVTVTMANTREDVTRIIADSIKQAARGGGGRAGARQQKEDHAWFEDTDEHVAMCAKGIVGVDASGEPNWLLLSQIVVDGTGVHQHVTEVQEDLVTAEASIEMNAQAITMEVTNRQNADNTLSGQIQVEAGKISQIVQAVGSNGQVTAASIVMAINNAGSSVAISADHVYISGTTRINDVFTVISNAVGVSVPMICSSDLTINSNGDLNVYDINLAGSSPITLNATSMAKAIKEAKIEGSGSNLTLKLIAFDGTEVNFTKAATTSLTDSWSGGKLTVTAQPGGLTLERWLSAGATTWEGNYGKVPINALWGSSGQYSESTGYTVSVNATPRYNAGYDSAHLSGSWGTGSNANLFTVSKVQSGSSNSLSCRVTAGISYNSTNHKYTATGYGNGASKATKESGTEAYDAGYYAGDVAGYSRGYTAGLVAGTAAGYKTGWNECIDACTAKQLTWTTYWTSPSSASARTCWWYSTYSNAESVLYLIPSKKS